MKNYNKILEAINNGIYLALDDFEDDEVQNIKSKKIQNRDYTKSYWVNNYDQNKIIHNPEDDGGIKGLNGRVFEGKNGNQMFIPAAGSPSSFLFDAGSCCRLWSSSLCLDNPSHAYYLYFNSRQINVSDFYRYCGYSIRPVINL